MFKRFIERPVLATVISIILVILGILGLTTLPLQQFPDIAPPAVQVTANYPGANAETVLRSVAPSLEESINGVENMSYTFVQSKVHPCVARVWPVCQSRVAAGRLGASGGWRLAAWLALEWLRVGCRIARRSVFDRLRSWFVM